MKTFILCMFTLVIMLAYACNEAQLKQPENVVTTADIKLEETNKLYANSPASDTVTNTSSISVLQAGQPKPDWDKQLIKTAGVRLEVNQYAAYNATVHNMAKRYAAYISSEEQEETEGQIQNVLAIKVPVDQFDNLLAALQVDGVKVLEKKITSEDVTGEVVDTKARVEAKKQVRDRYVDLLKQAKNMKEILEVQNEINAIQEDIEAGSGKINYLQHAAAYSTINLTYFQYLKGSSSATEKPSFFTKVMDAFTTGTSIISGLVIMLVTLWPIIAGVLLIMFLYKRKPFSFAGRAHHN